MKFSGPILIMVFPLTSYVGIGVMGGKEERVSFGINETRSKPMRRVTDAEDGKNPTRKEIPSSLTLFEKPLTDRKHVAACV